MARYTEFIKKNKIKSFEKKVTDTINDKVLNALAKKEEEIKNTLFQKSNIEPKVDESVSNTDTIEQLETIIKNKSEDSITLKNGDVFKDISPKDAKRALLLYKKDKNIFNSEEAFISALFKE